MVSAEIAPDGELGAARLGELAARWGTPLYVLSLTRLRAALDAVRDALAPATVLYSLKTNYLPAVTTALASWGAGVDVVSGYELRAARRAGFPTDRIVFNGPVKTPAELREAVAAGAYVNIDGLGEIDTLAGLAGQRALPVGLRVYPPQDVYAGPLPLPDRALPSKFGWPIATGDADRVADLVLGRAQLLLTGVHCHLGSQITSAAALLEALGAVLDWVAKLRERAPLGVLNVGGGFGVPGIHRIRGAVAGLSEVRAAAPVGLPPRFDLAGFGRGLRGALADRGLADLAVYCEPGRALVSAAQLLLTSVAAVKPTAQGTWVLLDGGLNLLPTAGVAEQHRIEALRDDGSRASYLVGGPLCYEGDVFTVDARLPADIRPGDLVAIHDAGAYSVSRATSFNRPRAPVVAVSGDAAELCWRAEEDVDIFRFGEVTQ
jgi:diaminopimelate decarboxylase